MIRYLNRDEKETLLIVGVFMGYLNDMIDKMVIYKRPKLLLKWIRMARSFTTKIVDHYQNSLEPAVYLKMMKEMTSWKVQVCYTDQAKREHAQTLAIKDNIVIHKDELALICDRALAFCRLCNRHGQAVEDCKLRRVLMNGWVDPANPEAELGDCQYREAVE